MSLLQPGPAGPASAPTAVVAAMRAEVAPLLDRMRVERRLRLDGCRVALGTLARAPLVLGWTGEGAVRAERGARALLDRFPASSLIVVGVSGGLSADLAPGTLLAARALRTDLPDARPRAGPDPVWLSRALERGARAATLLSSDRILATAGSKARAAAKMPRGEPAAVDLESASYARVAVERGLAYLVLRAVCDPLDEELPLDFDACRDRAGRVSRLRVVRRALLRPAAVGGLWRLRQRVASSAVALADLVEDLVGEAGA